MLFFVRPVSTHVTPVSVASSVESWALLQEESEYIGPMLHLSL